MQSKEKNNNSTCTKSKDAEIPLSAEKVAEIAGVSVSTVKKVRAGIRNAETKAGERVELTEDLWNEGSNILIREIKRLVPVITNKTK